MQRPCSSLWIAAALSLAASALLSPSAHGALSLRLRSAASPSPTNSAMAMPLPAPPPPPSTPADFFPRIGSGLSADVIRRVIWVHINQIRYCYQQALFKQPTLAGRMVVNFQVNPQGQVLDLSVRDTTLQSPELLTCVSDSMRAWEFPPTPTYDGVTEVNYPFVLRPRVPEPVYGVQISDAELERLGIVKDPEPPQVDVLF